MTNANQELTVDQLEQTSGGGPGDPWGRSPWRFAEAVKRFQHVPGVPKFLSLDVMRPWFK